MTQYYPGIIEAAIEFKMACRKLLIAKGKNKLLKSLIADDIETINHTKQFRLEKHPETKFIYCCLVGQTLRERM